MGRHVSGGGGEGEGFAAGRAPRAAVVVAVPVGEGEALLVSGHGVDVEPEMNAVVFVDVQRVSVLGVAGAGAVEERDRLRPGPAFGFALIHHAPDLIALAVDEVQRVLRIADHARVGGLVGESLDGRPLRDVVGPQRAAVLERVVVRSVDNVQMALAVRAEGGAAVVVVPLADFHGIAEGMGLAVVGADPRGGVCVEPGDVRTVAQGHNLVAGGVGGTARRAVVGKRVDGEILSTAGLSRSE